MYKQLKFCLFLLLVSACVPYPLPTRNAKLAQWRSCDCAVWEQALNVAPQGAAGPCLFLGRPPGDSEGNAKEPGGDQAWQRSLTAAARLLHLHTGRSPPPTEIPL